MDSRSQWEREKQRKPPRVAGDTTLEPFHSSSSSVRAWVEVLGMAAAGDDPLVSLFALVLVATEDCSFGFVSFVQHSRCLVPRISDCLVVHYIVFSVFIQLLSSVSLRIYTEPPCDLLTGLV
jgi:hypothetical protein